MSMQQVQQSLKSMDTNSDGHITKTELFNALKKMNTQSGIFGLSNQTGLSQAQSFTNNNSIQYPNFSNVTLPAAKIQTINQQPVQQLVQQPNVYAKPQITSNFIMSQVLPA